ncbi:MAG: hypothetical protein ACPGLV_13150 [Bacteroidia bacterium]
MKKFLAIYYSPAQDNAEMANITNEQRDAIMAEWMAWKNKVDHAIVDFGAPLINPTSSNNGKTWKTGNTEVGGYSILQAENIDVLKTICSDHPHLQAPGATLELQEMVDM